MSGRLEGRRALVTGGGSGIGRATALLFAAEGASVMIAELSEEAGAETVALIEEAGGSARLHPTDVTSEESIDALYRRVGETMGGVDVLFNCAGGSTATDGPTVSLKLDVLESTMALDLASIVLMSQRALPGMMERGRGAILNMSSFIAFRALGDMHAYAAAKGAVASLTRAMAASYARDGVRVNAIAPGRVLTERARARLEDPSNPLGGFDWDVYPFATGEPHDIASIALFLVSDESRMLTGQVIHADGGMQVY